MAKPCFKIIFYGQNQHQPIIKFIQKLDLATQAKVYRLLEKLAQYGFRLQQPFIKKIDSNIYELRTLGKVNVRLLYTVSHNQVIVLNAFVKKTKKTPKKELKIALDRLKSLV